MIGVNIPKNKRFKCALIVIILIIIAFVLIFASNYVLQHIIAHSEKPFTPNYKKVTLTKDSDYETIFLQTGLGKATVDKLIAEDRFDKILEAQELFFKNDEVECLALLGEFTREDRLKNEYVPFYDLRAGDILITLSTHSLGWRHGHAAIVIDENTTVESVSLGINSSEYSTSYWNDYSNFAVLRVKDVDKDTGEKLADFCRNKLVAKPYSLLSGFGINKAPDCDSESFATHCSYLAWYAWNSFGVDLDSDGGRLVTSYDILHSDKVEIVQLYGMNPKDFI